VPKDNHRECHVLVASELLAGVPAVTLRILHDSGTEWFLDFWDTRGLVARVRVQESFLPAIRDRLGVALLESSRSDIEVQ